MSAHYDSRGSFGSIRHPGADDDGVHHSWPLYVNQLTNHVGSGATAILAIARTISRKRIQFKSNIELVAFVRLLPPPFPSLILCLLVGWRRARAFGFPPLLS
jgi:hypothetical protein